MLRDCIERTFAAQKHKHSRVASQRMRKNLGSFNTKVDSIIFDGRDGCSRNAGQLGELRLVEFLEFTEDADRFTNGDLDTFFRQSTILHFKASDKDVEQVGGKFLMDVNWQIG